MNTSLFTLPDKTWIKGLVTFILAAVITYLYNGLNGGGFDLFTANWGEVLKIALTAGFAYVGKGFLTTKEGKFAGVIKTEG